MDQNDTLKETEEKDIKTHHKKKGNKKKGEAGLISFSSSLPGQNKQLRYGLTGKRIFLARILPVLPQSVV